MSSTFVSKSFLCLGALLAIGGLLAAAETGTVRGSVQDASGAAVSGAVVSLHQLAGSALLKTASDPSGRYLLANVAAGEYLLNASAPGLSAARVVTIALAPGESRTIPIQLIVSSVRTEVSVTAASEPQSLDQVSKALDVVNVPQAETRGLFSVSDAVRFVPGLRVTISGGPGALTTIQSRGLPPEDTGILFDGFRFRDPSSPKGDATAQIGDLLLIDSSRIEVLRGSGSSLYGTNSVAGTVNVLTDTGGAPLHGDVDFQGGGLGLFRGLAKVAGGAFDNRLTYSAGLAHLNVTDGVDSAGAARNWSGQGGLLYALTPHIRIGLTEFAKTGFLQDQLSPAATATAPTVGIIPAIALTTAQIHLADANLPYDPGSATFIPALGDPDAGVYSRFTATLLRFEQEVNSRLSYRVAFNFVDSIRDNTNGPAGPGHQPLFNTSDRYTGRVGTLQARVNYLLGSHQVLTAGYEFEQEHYLDLSTDQNPDPTARAYFRTDATQRSNAVFAQDEIRLLSGRLQILLSGRFTAASLHQPKFINAPSAYAGLQLPSPPAAYTGDASLAYFLRSTSTKLRAHVGNSFRLPSLYERFGESVFEGYASVYGDPRLSPERTVSGDVGVDQYLFHEHLKVSATYFYAHLQQVIGFEDFPLNYVDPYGRFYGYYNTGGGISRGAELSGDFHPTTRTTINASYTYTNARDRISQYYTGTAFNPLQSVRILPHDVKIVALQQLGRSVDVSMDFEGGSNFLFPLYGPASGNNGYAYQFAGPRQLGLAAGYSIPLKDRLRARLYVRVSNALDQSYYENAFRTPGRWAVAGVRLSF